MKRRSGNVFVTPQSPKNHAQRRQARKDPNPIEKYVWLDDIKELRFEALKGSTERIKYYNLHGHIEFGSGGPSKLITAKYKSLKYAKADQRRFVEELAKPR